jgi:hypothetical protein
MALTTIIGAVLRPIGSWFGGRHARYAAACGAFRETFATELQGLYPDPVQWPKGFGINEHLRSRFQALQAAVTTFRPHVPKRRLDAFDDAWLTYYSSLKRRNEESYDHYYGTGGVDTVNGLIVGRRDRGDGKRYFRENVDRLLSFATAL